MTSLPLCGQRILDRLSGISIPQRMHAGIKLLFWPLAVLTLIVVAMELGAWRISYDIAGPFAEEIDPPRRAVQLAVPREGSTPWWRQPLIGDTGEKPFESTLQLSVAGRKIGPAHAPLADIRSGKSAGFSHWHNVVVFTLPPGATNTPKTTATIAYSVRPRPWIAPLLLVISGLLGWPLYRGQLTRFAQRLVELVAPIGRRLGITATDLLRTPYFLLFGLWCLGLAASAVFVGASLYAWLAGWALPTTALIRWSPAAEWAAQIEPYLGYVFLTLSGLGVLATWSAASSLEAQRVVQRDELWLRNFLRWSLFPVVACAFVFSMSAIWAGMLRLGDFEGANVVGLVPFSDATYHLAAAYDQIRDGTWIAFAQRRLFAAAFRSVLLVFGNQSLPVMEALQACLIAAAASFAAHRLAVWRGIWSAMAFLSLTYIYARVFAPTMLTEPLALIWALLSVGFFAEAFRSKSVHCALIAFALTLVALMIRMGSMFTIPALLVWLIWQFGRGFAARVRIGIVSLGILLGIVGMNAVLQKAYGTQEGSSGGNFAYVLCGLSMGTDWQGCPAKLAAEGRPVQGGEAAVAEQLYRTAWENVRARPDVIIGRLADAVQAFITGFPQVMWNGYNTVLEKPDWWYRNLPTAVSLLGIGFYFTRRSDSVELSFWMLFWSSLLLSASIVYFDDGNRVLAASQPLIALFFAAGFGNPFLANTAPSPHAKLSRYAALALVAAAVLFVSTPWLAYRFYSAGIAADAQPEARRGEAFVFGGRRMSGFLVVDDNVPLPTGVPSIHLADFDAIVALSGLEYHQALIHPKLPPMPFGFVFAPRLEKGTISAFLYIVPAEVLERRDVPAWHFKLMDWGKELNGLGYWFYVPKAEPWSPPGETRTGSD